MAGHRGDPGPLSRATTEGVAPIVMLVVVLWVVFLPIVVGLNYVVTRVTAVRRLPYRVAAALLVTAPFGWEMITSA